MGNFSPSLSTSELPLNSLRENINQGETFLSRCSPASSPISHCCSGSVLEIILGYSSPNVTLLSALEQKKKKKKKKKKYPKESGSFSHGKSLSSYSQNARSA
jgi:hypothetical protein